MAYHPKNTAAKFTTVLSQPVDLSGDWEVALYEIAFPARFENVNAQDCWMKMNEKLVSLPGGRYEHVVDVLRVLVDRMNKIADLPSTRLHVVKDEHPSNGSELIDVIYEEDRQKVVIRLTTESNVEFSTCLGDILGLSVNDWTKVTTISGHKPSRVRRARAFPTAYVYADIVQPVAVGDTQVPLLRTVNVDVDDDEAQMIHHVYATPLFVPLGKKHFQTIEVNIMTDIGQAMPFVDGKSIVVLHFKRTSNPYFLP